MKSYDRCIRSQEEVLIMITLLFTVLLISVVFELIGFAIKLTWGLGKILCWIIFFPVVLVVLAFSGLFALAIPVLLIVGIGALVKALIV